MSNWITNTVNGKLMCPHCNMSWSFDSRMKYCPGCGKLLGALADDMSNKPTVNCLDCWTPAHPCGYRNISGYCPGYVSKEEGVRHEYSFAVSQSKRSDVDDAFRDVWAHRAEEIRVAAEKEGINLK